MPPQHRTAADFIHIIYEPVLGPYLDAHLDASSLTLMEDEAPVHRSKALKVWEDGRVLRKLDWPAQNPYLIPIKNIWKILKDGILKEH